MPKRFALAVLGLLLVTATWAQEVQKPAACPRNINLTGANLESANLSDAALERACQRQSVPRQ